MLLPQEDIQTLDEMFETYTVDNLHYLASNAHKLLKVFKENAGKSIMPSKISQLPTRKAELIKWLVTSIHTPAFLRTLYGELDSPEREAVQEIVHSPNRKIDHDRFIAKYNAWPKITSSKSYYGYGREKEEDSFGALGLFITSSGKIPMDVQTTMVEFVPKPRGVEVPHIENLPGKTEVSTGKKKNAPDQHLTEHAALSEVMAVLQMIDAGKISVGAKTGKPTLAAANALRMALSNGDYYPEGMEAEDDYDVQMGGLGIRPFAWIMLLQAGNATQLNGTKLILSRTGRALLKTPPHEILKRLWERWLKTKVIHEMSRIEAIKGQKSKKRPLAAAEQARRQIALALSHAREGKWVKTKPFFNFLIAKGFNFSITRNSWALYISDSQYGSLGYDNVDWEILEGRFARAFLLEYAATLGLIDVALVPPWGALSDMGGLWGSDGLTCLSRYDGLSAIRLNSLGSWILGIKEKYVPSFHDKPSLQVLPNLDITMMGASMAASDRLFLERFCEKVSERVWHIVLGKFLEAVEKGIDPERIKKFLTERNQCALPQPVVVFLEDAIERTKKIRCEGDATLIRCADPVLRQLIASDTQLKKICIPAGESHLVVLKEYEEQFKKGLRKLGYVFPML